MGGTLHLNLYFLLNENKNRTSSIAPAMFRGASQNVLNCLLVSVLFTSSPATSMAGRGPVIVRIRNPGSSGSSGLNCCCCRCCTCLNIEYLKSQAGIYKLAEAILGAFCQSLALEFGMSYAGAMGPSYYGFLTTSSWCMMTTILLLICYVLSEKSVSLIRQSMFEFIFNGVAAFCYLSSTSYLGYIVNTILFPIFKSTAYFQAYPAMTGAYLLGTVVGVIHGIDAYKSYKYFKGYR